MTTPLTPSVGFIGGGRIARIMLDGWTRAQKLPRGVIVFDPDEAKLAALKRRFPTVTTTTVLTQAGAQDVVFLATHPPAIAQAAGALAPVLKSSSILVSLAPKYTIAKLATLLGGFARIARSNPNAASLVGRGMNPITFAATLDESARSCIRTLFEPLGESPEVAENKIEAYAVITAMGPTYLWFQMDALRTLAISFGLDPAEADVALKRMVCGAARTLVESGLPAVEVMDLVPVKPLAEMETNVLELYRTRLPAVFAKITPGEATPTSAQR